VIVVVLVELGVIVKFKDSATQFIVVPVYTPVALYVVPFQVYELQAVIVVVFVELGVIVKFKDSVTQFVVVPVYTPDVV
jgi:hypothetical protein